MLESNTIPDPENIPEPHVWDNGDETQLQPTIKKYVMDENTDPEIEAEEL